jgi:L-ascorbate metabolism protein UlaG (beta-lactamase superfamily)
MKSPIVFTGIVLLFLPFPDCFAQHDARVYYVANEGFLVETGGKKILMDGLFGGFKASWCDVPSPETRALLENAKPPFDGIDVAFVSHRHLDHFTADIVVSYLSANQKCMLVCPMQIRQALSVHKDFEKIRDRIIAATPGFGSDTSIAIGDIAMKIYRLEHNPYFEKDSATGMEINIHKDVENLGCLIDACGFRFFHCGDAYSDNEDEFRNFHLADEHIEVAFLSRQFIIEGYAKGIRIIEERIKPRRIMLMHVEPGGQEKYRNHVSRAGVKLPEVIIFDRSMDCREIATQ